MTGETRPTPSTRGPVFGILLKVASTLVFTAMVACVKAAAATVPVGEVMFARSFLGLVPVLTFLAVRGELAQAFRTQRLGGHFLRSSVGVTSMALWFTCLALIPLPEALAIGYASPLVTVVFAALFLGETVRIYRWSAVVVGFLGILIILAPRFTPETLSGAGTGETIGALLALASAFTAAGAMVLIRRLITTERTPAIVVYFSLIASGFALLTLPWGWVVPDSWQALLLVLSGLLGGIGQILMTESYRHADASTIATFDYSGMIWGLAVGYLLFGETAEPIVLIGMAIVIAAGMFIIWRERHIGLARPRAGKLSPPAL
ncbi:MAG: DMT family transporter [Hyphomicrobiaceae bacterium]